MILLVKGPVPVPFDVRLSPIVGYEVVDQQTPRAVMVASPSSVILPPETAVVEVIEDTTVVESVAITTGSVVNDRSLP